MEKIQEYIKRKQISPRPVNLKNLAYVQQMCDLLKYGTERRNEYDWYSPKNSSRTILTANESSLLNADFPLTISHLTLIKRQLNEKPQIPMEQVCRFLKGNTNERLMVLRILSKVVCYQDVPREPIIQYIQDYFSLLKGYIDGSITQRTEFVNSKTLEPRFFFLFLLKYSFLVGFGLWDSFNIEDNRLIDLYGDNDGHLLDMLVLLMQKSKSISVFVYFLDSIEFDAVTLMDLLLSDPDRFSLVIHTLFTLVIGNEEVIKTFLENYQMDGETDYYESFISVFVEFTQSVVKYGNFEDIILELDSICKI